MQSFGGSCLEIIHHPNGMVRELMIGQEETEETGYWFGRTVSATLQPQQLRIIPGIVNPPQLMGIVNFSSIKGCNQSSSSRCLMKYITMEKGKVAADHSHKWIYKEQNDQEINFLSAWHNSADSRPRTWEAQFQSGIKTIALIAVREGVVQLGAVHKVIEDLSYVALLRKKFSYIESIPGVLLPHPSSSVYPFKADDYGYGLTANNNVWHYQPTTTLAPPNEYFEQFNEPMKITPSMSSLEALLSKLPSVVPPSASGHCESQQPVVLSRFGTTTQTQRPAMESSEVQKVAKEEMEDGEDQYRGEHEVGESSSSMSGYHHQHYFDY
ncbi:uncharacterized protein LOC123213044 isoform X2 [Mangifera indica]|uniref:uncharacterized protein LOC123213044 isoform X2 n=1 Tax=Mangifera indica TaxID=29780 RepID=UPI001CFB29B1|nr:uncharacterized protein LOC123213044 isoform X2 [Mangifera indica]